jgi:hypothetical protein
LELPNVTGPIVIHENVERFVREVLYIFS